MLHAKDLRFGNKVFNREGQVITVQQILYSSIVYDTHMQINNELAAFSNSYYGSYTSEVVEVVKETELQDVEPIPLTSSILQACGFRNFVREEWIINYGKSHADFVFTSAGLCLRPPTPSHVVIKYVHQLQNFYFALTGHELEVNFQL